MQTRLLLMLSVVVALPVLGSSSARAEGRVGVMIDAGVPDGAGGALVFSPISRLRVHAGASHNGISTGVRGGVSVAAWTRIISPTFTVEAGRFFEGDAQPIARAISGDSELSIATLEKVGYDFANAHVGIEIGGEPVTFFLHAGASVVQGQIRNLDTTFAPDEDSGVTLRIEEDPTVTVYGPSARLGFLFYF